MPKDQRYTQHLLEGGKKTGQGMFLQLYRRNTEALLYQNNTQLGYAFEQTLQATRSVYCWPSPLLSETGFTASHTHTHFTSRSNRFALQILASLEFPLVAAT